jgi:polyhydroxyalkanoate synthesis regulator phasin
MKETLEEELVRLRGEVNLHKSNEIRLRRERDSYRQRLYDHDDYGPVTEESARKYVEQLKEVIRDQEEEITAYEGLSGDIQWFQSHIGHFRGDLDKLEKKLRAFKKRNEAREAKIAEMEH